jgi:hypothetical protein
MHVRTGRHHHRPGQRTPLRKYGGMIRRGVTCLQAAACRRRRQPHPRAACMHDAQCSAVRWLAVPAMDRVARAISARLRCGGDRWLPAWPHTEIDTVAVRPMASFCWSLLFRRDLNSSCLRYPPPLLSVRLLLSPVLLDSETESSSSSRHRCVEPRTYARAALVITSYS